MTILFLPSATPLVGMFCLGNLMREAVWLIVFLKTSSETDD
ncbi:hypothetical protein O9929_07575 [Vibrio lentus]|nr:hypothetical protein [Vibrio lentus]